MLGGTGQFGRLQVRLVADREHGPGAVAGIAAEKLPAFHVDEPGHRIGEVALLGAGVGALSASQGVHVEHPAGAEQFDRATHLGGHEGQFFRCAGGRVLSPKFPGRQQAPILAQHHAGGDQGCIRQKVG